MNNEEIREELFRLSDSKYKKFQSSLCPGINNIIGVRTPNMRKLAKELASGDWNKYLKEANDQYYEEIMLQGMVIGYIKKTDIIDINELFKYLEKFIPKIDNWAVCDAFCTGLKITKSNKEKMWKFITPYLKSEKEFEIRFVVVMILTYYLTDEYIDDALNILNNINHEEYYVKMAVAWAISISFIKYPEKSMVFLKNSRMDKFTYNKSLQKILDSYRVDKDTKKIIKSMKIK